MLEYSGNFSSTILKRPCFHASTLRTQAEKPTTAATTITAARRANAVIRRCHGLRFSARIIRRIRSSNSPENT